MTAGVWNLAAQLSSATWHLGPASHGVEAETGPAELEGISQEQIRMDGDDPDRRRARCQPHGTRWDRPQRLRRMLPPAPPWGQAGYRRAGATAVRLRVGREGDNQSDGSGKREANGSQPSYGLASALPLIARPPSAEAPL